VKRLLALLVGGLGMRALLRRRSHAGPAAPVDELRRADVHERARRAMDELGES
jgi:hypothetical protein